MRPMKEKLVKNHYKGFDHRAKMASYACLGLLFAAVCTFLPLTILAQQNVSRATAEAQQQQETQVKASTEKTRVKIILDC
jgi:hypothetical protein